jgi:hypothetical protein
VRRLPDRAAVATFVERYGPGLAGVAVFLAALWAQTDAMVGVFYDDGLYVALGKALAEGRGYVSLHLPGEPPAVHYPPLYPAALAALWRVWPQFPANVLLFRLFDAAAMGTAGWILARHAARTGLRWELRYAALLAAMLAFPLLTIVGVRFSEPLFLALFGGAILSVERDGVGLGRGAVAGVLAGLATLTRSIGLAAVVGIPWALWLRGRRAAAVAAFAAGAALAVPWWIWISAQAAAMDPVLVANYGTYGQYAAQAGATGVLAGLNLQAFSPFPRLLLPGVPPMPWYLLGALLAGVAGVGITALRRQVPVLLWVLLPYVAIVVLWPFTPDRFMWILLPWLGLFLVAGALRVWRWGAPGRIAVGILAMSLLIGFGQREFRSLSRRGFARTAADLSGPFRYLVRGIDTAVPGDAVVATDGEALVYLYTGRRTVPLVLLRLRDRAWERFDTDATAAYFCASGVTHVATSWVDGEAAPLLADLRAAGDSVLTPLFALTDGPALFRFRCPR